MSTFDLAQFRREVDTAKAYEHDGAIVLNARSVDSVIFEIERLRHVAGECECRPATFVANGVVGTRCGHAASACEHCGGRHAIGNMTLHGIPVVECPEAPPGLTFRPV